ncbi:MAG: lasso RiPP family leader peptide-containing protein [Acidobacteriia bacterium]|nr:lasso RiPP family leader peptide-containing protein [Terriglobia bacterium]
MTSKNARLKESSQGAAKKPYETPRVRVYGDVSRLTRTTHGGAVQDAQSKAANKT